MGLFDFFSGKKKEKERQEQLRIQQEQKRHAEEKRKIAELQNFQEQKRQEEKMLSNFDYDSTCHQRYENGRPVRGLQICPRYIKIRKNTNGCSGYQLTNGDGYILTATNGETGKPQFSPKPMRVVKFTDAEILLKGYTVSAQTPFGWQDIDLSDYGFSIFLDKGSVKKCVLHLYDRNVDLEYMKSEKVHDFSKRNSQSTNTSDKKDSPLVPFVDNAIATFESGNISQLQNELYHFASLLNKPGSGKLIINFPQKDRLCEVFNLCLEYDWMEDPDIREVWAENAFYCIAEYFKTIRTKQDYIAAALDLFLTCSYGKESLRTKFNDVLYKARIHPQHCIIFSKEEYNGGADYLIREFSFFSATIISPVVRTHPNIISSQMKSKYENAKTDFEFANVTPDDIMRKMLFLSAIIGSILDDM